ncbi:MAG: VTC domain-containing protein [Bacteroidales bacterium]|nr:VTC domain-containing protein [Bacteroidales bacterium]
MSTLVENIQYRYERKFVFENKHPAYVEMIVKNHPSNFHEIFQQRQVNNIYFDKQGLRYYHDNFDGNTNRKKVRIRWYGNPVGQISKPILEFKIKKGELGIKKSYILPDFVIEKGFNARQIKKLFEQTDLPDNVREEIMGLEAQLLNSYSRRYFRSFDYNFRFTVDHKMEYFKLSQYHNLFLHKIPDYQNVILELKYDMEFASEVAVISSKLPVRLSKFSKYISGMEKLYPQLV